MFDRLLNRHPKPAEVLSTAITEGKKFENALAIEHTRYLEQKAINRKLAEIATDSEDAKAREMRQARAVLSELVEAQSMCGSGPWLAGEPDAFVERCAPLREAAVRLREGGPVGDISPIGAYGMYELLLQNVNWQREINYSALEFTRFGIQQIILICRLYYLKNPIPRRLVDVIAQYVFARGFDVTTDDETANEEIKDFIRRNQKTLGHVALTAAQRSKLTDGNLFYAFFTDQGTGKCDLRLIDATEIQEIWTDPEDSDTPWYYQRMWTQRVNDPKTGERSTVPMRAWYPAIDYEPTERPATIKGDPVMWDVPVYHRKVGTVGKWLFGCPPLYPMLDWAKEGRRVMEACASNFQSLAQWAATITTKGGQQAVEGIKQQMETQVGPGSPIYDTNPPAITGATWVSGPGTTLKAFNTSGAVLDPEKVRRYLLMCCMVLGMPETFLGDVSTGNLATATSLDRPTETVFLSIQEEWIEDLTVIVAYMLKRSLTAANGRLRESCVAPGAINIVAGKRSICSTLAGARYWGYREAKTKPDTDIEIRVLFPAIREGDIGGLVKAGVEAMTLDNKGGQVVGIDERAGVLWLMQQLGIEQAEELIEQMYPTNGKDAYDPNRQVEELPPPISKLQDQPGATKTPAQAQALVDNPPKSMVEAVGKAFDRLKEAIGSHLNGTDAG